MKTKKLFVIAGETFPTKARVIERCRKILYRCHVGSAVTSIPDCEFLASLIERHPDAEDKIGCGILCFEVRRNRGGTRGFWIVRRDGSETDFSFGTCVSAPSHEQNVRDAFRTAIKPQIAEARQRGFANGFVIPCPITSQSITRKTCQVDHADPTFLELVDQFAASEGGYSAISIVSRDGDIGGLLDPAVEGRWQRFHAQCAKLRVVSKRANLSLLRKKPKAA